jgi:hypothetical protein
MPTAVERIDIMDRSEDPAVLVCSFFWSEPIGLSCTDQEILDRLTTEGIATPPDGERVFPRDGRKFFEALRWRYCSVLSATDPRPVTGN